MSGPALWLPDLLRDEGLNVVTVAGWEKRGRTYATPNFRGSVNHHTAGSRNGNAPSLGICISGRSDLPGPLCQCLQARDNTIYVIAAGIANHAGRGGWNGLVGNQSVLGLEVENVGYANVEPWRPDQVDTMAKVHTAFAKGAGFNANNVCQHKEWTAQKPDAHTIAGGQFRAMVAIRLNAPAPPPPKPPETDEEDEEMILVVAPDGAIWSIAGVWRKRLDVPAAEAITSFALHKNLGGKTLDCRPNPDFWRHIERTTKVA